MTAYSEEIFEGIYELLDLQMKLHGEYMKLRYDGGGAPDCVIDEIEIITNRIRKNLEAEREWLKQ